MTTKRAGTITYKWMISREKFINTAAETILENEIAQPNFHFEAAEMFDLAKKHYLCATIHGIVMPSQIKAKEAQLFKRFEADLKAKVFNKMPVFIGDDY